MIAWREASVNVRGCLTSTATKDIAVRQVVLDAFAGISFVDISHHSTEHFDSGLAAAEECLTVIADIIPKIAFECLTIACRRVIIFTASVVTLTYRSHVSAAIDIASHMASVHGDVGVAHHLAGNKAVNVGFVIVAFVVLIRVTLVHLLLRLCTYF